MLDDRKFYYPIMPQAQAAYPSRGRFALRHWNFVGPEEVAVMDTNVPYVGEHTPLVKLTGKEPCGIQQSGLAVRKAKSYTGRIVLAGTRGVKISVTLIWGTNADERQVISIDKLGKDYQQFPLSFRAQANTDDASLEIVGTGTGSFHIGAVSLMPADNVQGFRREIVDALQQLHSGVYRFPGGNYVSGFEWTDAVGDPDRRPPRWDYAWHVMQPNDVGTDEFMALCKLLDVEPYITVNAGFGDAHSAADWVEYCNGAKNSTIGKWRATNGHPEPYGVKFWGVGNEAWGGWQLGAMTLEQFETKHNLFAQAMRAVDPGIKLIGSGAMPDAMTGSKSSLRISNKLIPEPLGPADWTGGLFKNCLSNLDLVSEHFYSYAGTHFDLSKTNQVPNDPDEPLVDWMRRPANHVREKFEAYEDYENLIPALKTKPVPICLDEWAFSGVPANSYKVVPAYAWVFHEMFRHSGLYQMAGFTFATSLISANRTEAVLNPAGLMFKMYHDHYGTIPVEVTGNSPQPKPKYPPGGEEPIVNAGSDTFPLDVAAALSGDKKSLTIAVINPTESAQQLNLSIKGVRLADAGRVWFMAPSGLNATNMIGQPPQVEVLEREVELTTNAMPIAPISVSIYKFLVE